VRCSATGLFEQDVEAGVQVTDDDRFLLLVRDAAGGLALLSRGAQADEA